ncbi:Serine/threonine-protein kinase AtPK2/AtPK19 [Turnera subulata]|uniref:Serine/threonine-protein kinase AtPK2/AtPK19 n=1 Tax=Turnera subulata TaxID=218843 RepID=A0A9Q0FLC5_9ROSI|nr:Serine/threonine-protein kinase AtPK2/AtPK19 [Turnera subulata]
MRKPFQKQLLFPIVPPDSAVSDQVELDFTDVFGPLPVQTLEEVHCGEKGDTSELVYDDPVVIYNRSHSLPPFVGGNREKIQQKIVKDKMKLPAYLSSEAHSLLKGLLHKEASKRLGNGASGSEDIKRHKWFKAINWKKLEAKEIQPSFRPEVAGTHCIANFEKKWTEMPLSDSPAASPKLSANPFGDFTYVRPAAAFLHKKSPLQ